MFVRKILYLILFQILLKEFITFYETPNILKYILIRYISLNIQRASVDKTSKVAL